MDQILFSAATASRKAWEVHWVREGEENTESTYKLLNHCCFHRSRLLVFTALCHLWELYFLAMPQITWKKPHWSICLWGCLTAIFPYSQSCKKCQNKTWDTIANKQNEISLLLSSVFQREFRLYRTWMTGFMVTLCLVRRPKMLFSTSTNNSEGVTGWMYHTKARMFSHFIPP